MGRRQRGVALVAALSTSLAWAAQAWAQNADTPVEVRTCDAGDALVSAIRVELAATTTPIAKVTVVCLAGARVLVVAFPRDADRPAAREVDVADVLPDARTRSVSLATGELLRSLEAGSTTSATPAAPAPAQPPNPVPPSAPPPIVVQVSPPPIVVAPPKPDDAPNAWSLGGTLHARTFPSGGTVLVGPSLELDIAVSRIVRLRFASDVGIADEAAPAGDVSLVTWSGSAALLARASSGALFLDAGPFVEGGAAFAEGSALGSDGAGTTGTRGLFFVGGEGIVGAHLGAVAVPFVAIDAGGVIAGVEALTDERAAIAVRGLFVGARVGVAIAP